MGFLELRCLNGVSEEVRRGAQGDSLQESGKSGLHAHGDGERVLSRVMVGESGLKTRRRTLKVFLGSQQETLGSLDWSR